MSGGILIMARAPRPGACKTRLEPLLGSVGFACGTASARPPGRVSGPLVSVVVPVLDEARELPGVLDHLASLPGRWEAVVVDGGSVDGTAESPRGIRSGRSCCARDAGGQRR